jgi:uncharacterized protein YbaP (TraB family)
MRKLATAAALAAACISASAAPASTPLPLPVTPAQLPDADPAIWVVNDADTTIYLFGTFHALDGKTAWFNDEVRTAFAASDELMLETIIPERGAAPQPRAPAGSASFLAATRMAMSAGRARGMQSGNGADLVLRQVAELWGKPVGGLETFSAQLGMFNRMPAQAVRTGQAPTPVQARAAMNDLSLVMTAMQSAWCRGDWRLFATMINQMRTASPESYNLMFAQRNAHWASWIEERLQRPGTVFVAVGTGHLVGRDSVQAKLALHGVRSERIN